MVLPARKKKKKTMGGVGCRKNRNSRNILDLDIRGRLYSLWITSGPTSAKKFESMARTKTSYKHIFLHILEILRVISHVWYTYNVMTRSRGQCLQKIYLRNHHDLIFYFYAYSASSFIWTRLQCNLRLLCDSRIGDNCVNTMTAQEIE